MLRCRRQTAITNRPRTKARACGAVHLRDPCSDDEEDDGQRHDPQVANHAEDRDRERKRTDRHEDQLGPLGVLERVQGTGDRREGGGQGEERRPAVVDVEIRIDLTRVREKARYADVLVSPRVLRVIDEERNRPVNDDDDRQHVRGHEEPAWTGRGADCDRSDEEQGEPRKPFRRQLDSEPVRAQVEGIEIAQRQPPQSEARRDNRNRGDKADRGASRWLGPGFAGAGVLGGADAQPPRAHQ